MTHPINRSTATHQFKLCRSELQGTIQYGIEKKMHIYQTNSNREVRNLDEKNCGYDTESLKQGLSIALKY